MSELTRSQRLLRPLMNYLVERFYPNGLFFYGKGPLWVFDDAAQDSDVKTGSGLAALYLIRQASNSNAERLYVESAGVTINGEVVGDWRITIDRLSTHPENG